LKIVRHTAADSCTFSVYVNNRSHELEQLGRLLAYLRQSRMSFQVGAPEGEPNRSLLVGPVDPLAGARFAADWSSYLDDAR
jgi:hypothetical protein